ncbi:RDD family protein [Angustibacter peucedani]
MTSPTDPQDTPSGPQDTPAYGPPPSDATPGVPAGFGARFAARLVDGLVGVVISFVVSVPTGAFDAVLHASSSSAGFSFGRQTSSTALQVLVWGVYEVLLVHLRGQTLGMMALGIEVVDDATGARPSAAASFLRFLVLGGSYLLCFVPFLLVCLSPMWDSTGRERGWHDRAASVRVVKA